MRFKCLDGWRGVCAILVALYHLQAITHALPWGLVRHASLFVDFFFVLSGFVIAHAYADRLESGPDMARFVIRRFGRIWPLHAFMLAVLVGLEGVKALASAHSHVGFDFPPFAIYGPNSVPSIWTNLLFIQSFGLHDRGTWNMPSWSVAVEFYAYLVFGLVCVTARKHLGPISAVLMLGSAAIVALFSNMGTTYDFAFFRCLFGFFAGVLTNMAWRRAHEAGTRPPAWLEAAALIGVFAFVIVEKSDTVLLWTPLVFALAIWAFAFEAGPTSRLMSRPAIDKLGHWSYSIYMVHWLVFTLMRGFSKALGQVFGKTWFVMQASPGEAPHDFLFFGNIWITDIVALVYLAIVIGLAGLTHRFVEVPARKAFNNLAGRVGRKTVVTQA